MSSEIVLKVENIGKRYEIYEAPHHRLLQTLLRGRKQFYKEFWALKDVSFEVKKGETVGIIGRNGCGKSTLLQIIAGTLAPTTGSVSVNGKVAALLELGSGFNPDFTGRENVYMNGAIIGLPRKEMERKFDGIAAFADIGEFIDQPVKIYSSGMFIRLAFAVTLSLNPQILIVDEALSVGDMFFQAKCMLRMKNLIDGGTTILFVSHDMSAIKNLCCKAIFVSEGRIKKVGNTNEVVDAYHSSCHGSDSNSNRIETINQISPIKDKNSQDQTTKNDLIIKEYEVDVTYARFSKEQRYGDAKIQIDSVRVFDENDKPLKEINLFQKVKIKVCLNFKEISSDEYNVGFLVRNLNGLELFGARTAELCPGIPYKHKGEKGIVWFSFTNYLSSGGYTLAVGVSNKREVNVIEYYDWINNAFVFKSISPPNMAWGCFYNNMDEIVIV